MSEPLEVIQPNRQAAIAAREMDVLLDHLRRPFWSAKTACLVMAGIDPERFEMAHGAQRYRSFLPGGLQKNWLSADGTVNWDLVGLNAAENLKISQQIFRGESRSPIEWARLAHECGHEPSWLAFIRDVPEYDRLVSFLTRSSAEPASQRVKDPSKVMAGINRQRGSAANEVRQSILSAWDEGNVNDLAFQKAMLLEYARPGAKDFSDKAAQRRKSSVPMASERMIVKWIRMLSAEPGSKNQCQLQYFRDNGFLPSFANS